MNSHVVAQAAAGLASWLREREQHPSVVIGHDARHQSEGFARDLVEVLAGAGVDVALLPGPLPTPVLAFAVGRLHADAGVMVTASHNPATDNGLKVYLGDTSQIAPPADLEIADHIAQVGDPASLPRSPDYRTLDDAIVESYLDAAVDLVGATPRSIRVAYTPLHGVGAGTFTLAAARAGFTDVHVVAEQADPDPNFPTVAYPNPEEQGAMDRVLALAERMDADVALAHDPDADRCAVAVRDGAGLRVLTGDEVGVLLADHLLRKGRVGAYASSLVSSKMLGDMAAAHGLPWHQTLTGFKWIGKVPNLAYGYEEALGYCVAPHLSRDKDGISAGLVVLEMTDELKAAGLTLLDRLVELFGTYGVHLNGQVSVRLGSADEVSALMTRLRVDPLTRIGPVDVYEIDDLLAGYGDLPPTDGLRLAFNDGRIIIRPSGTEPKLKCYVEVVDKRQEQARATLDAICAALRRHVAL